MLFFVGSLLKITTGVCSLGLEPSWNIWLETEVRVVYLLGDWIFWGGDLLFNLSK
jgi:hypothetical protein